MVWAYNVLELNNCDRPLQHPEYFGHNCPVALYYLCWGHFWGLPLPPAALSCGQFEAGSKRLRLYLALVPYHSLQNSWIQNGFHLALSNNKIHINAKPRAHNRLVRSYWSPNRALITATFYILQFPLQAFKWHLNVNICSSNGNTSSRIWHID